MLTWFHQLDRTASLADVVRVCRDYLATWRPETLALLPPECRPGRLKSHEDIEALHACLVDEYRRTRLEGARLAALQRMTSFVVRASIRVAQLRASQENGGPSELAPMKGRETSTNQ
jgi:hypothetical protein